METSIGNGPALHFLHGNFHVLDQGQVNEGLCDGGQERVAGDGERPLVGLKHEIFRSKFGCVMVRSLHFVLAGGGG